MSVFEDAYNLLIENMGNLFDKLHNFFVGVSKTIGVDITPIADLLNGFIILFSSPGILLTGSIMFIFSKIIYYGFSLWAICIIIYQMYIFVMCIFEGEFLMSIRRFIIYQIKLFEWHVNMAWTIINISMDIIEFGIYEPVKIMLQFLAWARQLFQL